MKVFVLYIYIGNKSELGMMAFQRLFDLKVKAFIGMKPIESLLKL